MTPAPLPCVFDGEAFRPIGAFAKVAARQYTAGDVYPMAAWEDRSIKSHNHEFAWLKTAWENLPEEHADANPTPNHLRKRLLIQTGFFTETMIDVGTLAGALRVAAFCRAEDEFAHVVTRGGIVVVRKAKSQSRRSMDKAEFQRSKTAILEAAAAIIGVSVADLNANAGMAA